MDNQHRMIKGYRELSQEEIDLINKIKSNEAEQLKLLEQLFWYHEDESRKMIALTTERDNLRTIAEEHTNIDEQQLAAAACDKVEAELENKWKAHYRRNSWIHDARQSIYETSMFLTRAVANPVDLYEIRYQKPKVGTEIDKTDSVSFTPEQIAEFRKQVKTQQVV